jgi:hypothetical protein
MAGLGASSLIGQGVIGRLQSADTGRPHNGSRAKQFDPKPPFAARETSAADLRDLGWKTSLSFALTPSSCGCFFV